MIEAFPSTELKVKARNVIMMFPKLLSHINLSDIHFFRIERESGVYSLRLMPNDKEPFNFLLPFKYFLIVYSDYDSLSIDEQYLVLINKLLAIPKGYDLLDKPIIRVPDVVGYKEEEEVYSWLTDHKFPLT